MKSSPSSEPSGGFTAHPDGFEAELMDTPHHQKS
jgi:hypothetical protein